VVGVVHGAAGVWAGAGAVWVARVLESLVGVGDIYAGGVLLRRTRYDIEFWTDDPAGAGAANAVNVDGHIDITGIGEAAVLTGSDQLTLQLQDGRTFQFVLTGTGGSIVARGIQLS
jgi:hypothetical protein